MITSWPSIRFRDQLDSIVSFRALSVRKRALWVRATPRARRFYSDWPVDGGVGTGNWRMWKIESPIAPWNNYSIIATMGLGRSGLLDQRHDPLIREARRKRQREGRRFDECSPFPA